MSQPLHLVSAWNPSYVADAMDAHLGILLDWVRGRDEGTAQDDDVYVWWAKLRSPNRQQPLPHIAQILALDAQAKSGVETHLYLTDFRSLYVAHLGEITADDVRADAGESAHVPAYYRERGREADFWFRLFDVRRLVTEGTIAVVEELKRLRNTRYGDRPLSLYGGMVDLPLIVRRDVEEAGWFSDRGVLIGERRWAERDMRLRGQTERLGVDLRDNLIGRPLWAALELGTRSFLASAEAVFRQHRDDLQFDFAPAAVEYAKALEVELNALLRAALSGKLELPRSQSLGALGRLLEENAQMKKWLQGTLPRDAAFLVGEMPLRLKAVADLRNPGAHRVAVAFVRASDLRDEVLGIGQDGLIARLARAKLDRRK